MKHFSTHFSITLLMGMGFFGSYLSTAHASSHLEVSGWIPYWRAEQGVKDATKHISQLDAVFPFAYSVQSDGGIKDLAGLDKSFWQKFFKLARAKEVQVIPTVMWSDGESTHAVLRDSKTRKQHVAVIAEMVKRGGYDGVDIDYENKKADTIDYFSLFLKELKKKLGKKILSCTVEARTPPASLYKDIPDKIRYSNDYAVIARTCDRVQIMAYDQQRADIKLNRERAGSPYMPVSDIDWVRKVVDFTIESIPKEKVSLGMATYGYHYEVTVAPDWYRDYRRIGALNMPDMLDVAREYKVKPSRNASGEMSFTYMPKGSDITFPKNLKIPKNTPSGNKIAAQALAYANKTGKEVTFRIGWYADALSLKQKIDLAKKIGLKGVTLFKIDGEEDKNVWKYLK